MGVYWHDKPDGMTSLSRPPEKPTEQRILRSLMFTPGQRPKMIAKALGLHVDAVILDLEDGVPLAEKDGAADLVGATIKGNDVSQVPALFVRINGLESGRMYRDLDAVIWQGIDGVLVPKVESPREIWSVAGAISVLEEQRGIEAGSVSILVAIESAVGLKAAPEVFTSSERVTATMFGAEDYALDLGLPVRREGVGQQLLHARSALVMAATIARIRAFDQVWLEFQDRNGLRAEALEGRELGFAGKTLIHPDQIDIVNEVFIPSEEDVAHARSILEAFDVAVADGVGAVMLGGQLVELPIVERARDIVTAHERLQGGRE